MKIKVLKDTPTDKAGIILSMAEFKTKYLSHLSLSTHTNIEAFIKAYIKHSGWFEVYSPQKFNIGSWVWDNANKKLYFVSTKTKHTTAFSWKPYYITLQNLTSSHTESLRWATIEEINKYSFKVFCNGKLLVSTTAIYYFNNKWEELHNFSLIINKYIACQDFLPMVHSENTAKYAPTYKPLLGGLSFGGIKLEHSTIISISKILGFHKIIE